MPIFDNNGKKQNVQDAHIEKYMELYPDATTVMERDGKKYRVKAKDYNTFLGDTLLTAQPQGQSGDEVEKTAKEQAPQSFFTGVKAQIADTVKQAMQKPRVDKSGYTFTAEELGIEESNGNAPAAPVELQYDGTKPVVPGKAKEGGIPGIDMEAYNANMAKAVANGGVEAPVDKAEIEARLPQANAAMLQRMQQGQTVQGAFDRAYSDYRVNYPAIEAEELTSGLLDEYSKERASRQSQVEKDVENYSSARKWALNPYSHGNDAYNEMQYRSGATKLRKADELGMMEEFAEDAKSRILSDEGLKAKAEENAKALDMPVEKYVNEVAVPILQEKMYRQWLSPQEEQMKKNYNGVIAAAEGSLIGTLLGATRTDTEKYLSQVGQEAWRENASLLGRAAAGAGGMILDLPVFMGLGSLAAQPAKAVGGQVFKQLAKNETKRLVARGVSEAAAQRYANYAVRNGLKNRVLLNLSTAPLQSGLTFGMFDAGKTALNMSLNGEWNWGELGKSAAGGALMGGALGATGAVGGGLTHGLTGATKAAAKVAEFGVENAVFTEGGRLIGKLHGQQPENGWLEDYVESGATLLMIKAPNIVKNVSRIKGDKEASEVFSFNKLEREQLGKYGEDLNAVLESLLPKSARVYEDGIKINEGTFTEEYRRVMLDPDIAMTTKAKLMGIVEGKAMTTPRVTDAVLEGNRVMTYDPMGRLVEVKEYATEAKANTEYKKVADRAEVESVGVLEDMYMRTKGYEADDATVREWLAKNPDVTAENIANIIAKNSAGEKLTEGEQRILESLRKARREGLNDVRYLNDVLAELDVDPKDVMSGIEKPIDERTEAENRAVKAYTDILYQEIKAKVVEPFRRGEARRAEDIDTTVRLIESDRSVDETANDGMVYTTTAPSGEKVIITGGKVVLDNEGYIEVNQSEGLVAMFPDGSRKPVRPGDLREKVEVSNAEETKAARRVSIEERWRAEFESAENGWKALEPGAEIEVAFEGDIYKLKVEGRDERGDVVLSGEGASMALPESVVQDAMKQAEALKAENGKMTAENEVAPSGGQKGEKVVESSPTGEAAVFEQNIPVDEKGKKMWEQSTPEYIAEYIRVRKPEDVEAQMSVVSGMIEGLEKQKSKMDAMDAMDIDDRIAFWKKVGELIGGAKDVVDPISQLNAKHSSALTAFNSMLENIRREGNEQKAAIRYEGLENMVAELGKQLPEGYTIGVVDGKYTIVEAQPVAETTPVEDNIPQSQSDSSPTLVEQPTPQATNEMLPVSEPVAPIEAENKPVVETLSTEEVRNEESPGITFEEYDDADYFIHAVESKNPTLLQEYLDNFPEGAYRDGARAVMWMNENGRSQEDMRAYIVAVGEAKKVIRGYNRQQTNKPAVELTEGVKTEDVNQSENNLEMVAEGENAPGNGGVVDNNSANALQNGNNELNLQKENESDNESNQNDIPVGGQVPQSVPQGEHGTQDSQVSGMEETASRLRERIEADGGTPQGGLSRNARDVENRVTREYAQENGLWIPFEDVFKLGRPSKSGNEHDTYLNAEQGVIYKVNNRMNTPSILDLLDRMEQHNEFFPDSKYSLVGFTAVSENGDVWPVFAQEYVPNARMATNEEIDSYMGALGFTRVGDGRYSNGEVVIKDLKPRNALADADGDIYVVDAEFEQENTQKSGETAENESGKMYSPEELAQAKEQLGELNATSAPEFAARLFSIKPWKTLEEANAALKELLASYGETLNGQSLAVMPFLDKAQGLIKEYNKSQEPRSTEDEVAAFDKQAEIAKEREQRAGVAPRPGHLAAAIGEGNEKAVKEWKANFDAYLQKLNADDLPTIDVTIKGMQGRKKDIRKMKKDGYKDDSIYKAYDYIEMVLKKRKKELENEQRTQQSTVTSQGIVNTETLQPTMSESDFAELVKGDDIEAMRVYLKEVEDALLVNDASPFAGEMALREEYRRAVEQYGKENIPAEVMQSLNERMKPYAELSRELFDRKYALQDRVRELESAAEKATAAKEKQQKVENKNTAFGGFLADKTDLAASTAEKALNKKYNFDGKVMTVAEFVEDAVGRGDVKLSAIEEPKYKGASRAAWNRMDARQQEADAKRVKESGTKTVYTVNDHDLGKTAYDYAKFLQEKKAVEQKPKEKIEDVGEVLAGARKDELKVIASSFENATAKSLIELPFSKAFKKPDLKKAVESGALREEDALFYEAMFNALINSSKPKNSARHRNAVETWAEETYNSLQLIKSFVEADEVARDRAMAEALEDKFPARAEELAVIEKRKVWNARNNAEWGDKTTPNPVWVTHEVLKALGYKPGDKVEIPFGVLKANVFATGYEFYNKKGERLIMQSVPTVEEGIENIVWLSKIKRGDADTMHPVSSFFATPTKRDMGDSGRYYVLWGTVRNPRRSEFGSIEEANAFAAGHKEAVVRPIQEVVKRYGYKIVFRNPLTGDKFFVNDMEFETEGEAMQYLEDNYDAVNEQTNELLAKERGEAKKEVSADDLLEVAMVRGKEGWKYAVNIKGKYANNMGMPLLLREFDTREDAKAFLNESKNEVFEIYKKQQAEQKKFVFFDTGENSRIGEDYRGGRDVTAQDFMDTFGFRGVQFGNWTNQDDRQMAVNQAFDAFLDLAKLLGVSPKALSLNGELGMAFGSRGSGFGNAHYELGEIVINLTKTRGAGSLAHEWWHALDNYFARRANVPMGMVTDSRSIDMRPELRQAYNDLLKMIEESDFYKRSKARGDYWGRMHEVTARLMAEWVDQSLKDKGELNTFLSRGVNEERYKRMNYDTHRAVSLIKGKEAMSYEEFEKTPEALAGFPYPSREELKEFGDAMRNIFETVEEKTEDGQTVLFQQGMIELDRENPAFERATENVRKKLEATGVKVNVLTKEEAESELARLEELADMQKRKSPETALPEDESSFKGTVISSDNGTKVLKDLDSAIERYENKGNSTKTFIGDVGKILHAVRYGSKSEYADFITANGIPVRIRLADHNAKISNFDHYDVDNGISIVISRAENTGVVNDGDAHLVEFFYSDKKLKAADGKPLVEILKSIKQALYSGEYKDNTGLAQAEEVNIPEFLRTSDGTTYGWAVNGEIYLTPEGINPNTPIHEYTHLWAAALQKSNPKLWSEVVEAMKLSPAWNEVMADENYTDIHGDDNRVASEVLSRLSGNEGYRRYMEQAEEEIKREQNIGEKVRKKGALNFFKRIWNKFQNWLQGVFKSGKAKAGDNTEAKDQPWEVFVNKTLKDFDEGMNPDAKDSPLDWMFIGKKGAANLDKAEEATTRLDNLNVAPEQDVPVGEVESKPISRIDLSNGPVKGVNEPEWKFKARREKWRRWVESNTNVKTPMPEKPFLQEGESIEEYAARMKEFNKELNKWKRDILSNESEIEKMMDILYDGKIPEMSPTPEDEFTEQVFKRYMGDDGIKVDRKSMRGMIMDEIIERRRKIETNNFDDVVFIDKVRKATTAEQRKAIPFIIEGTYNGKVTPELAAVVNRIRDWFENVYQALQAADAMHSSGKIKNYVTHIWDKKRTPKAVYENYISTRSKYTNRRSIETYAEGIALGMVPKYDDICDIMLEYGHIANEAIANKDFTDFLHMLRVDGEPVLKDATIRDPMYVRTSAEALDGYKVHKYAKGIVETVLGNIRTENAAAWMQKLAHFYDMTGSLMKKINLSLSFFHHGALIETAVGAMGPAKTISTVFKNLVWDCMRSGELPALSNPEAARNAVNHLVQLGATQDYMAKEVNRITGRLKEVLQDFSDKHPNFATKAIVKPAELIDFLNTGFDKVLWDYLHDGLKIYAFDKYAKEIEEYCKQKGVDDTTKDMLLNEAGQFVNDTFGGQFWELIHWSPATVKWMGRLLLSPDWTTSTIRQALSPLGFGTLYKDYEKNWFKRTFSGIPEAVTQRRKMGAKFWIIAMLTFVPLMNALNAWRRKDDVDEELRKAEERRKTDPEYKSPYELKYPEGMKWYDYTMYGNTIGHQTHLFGWRYDDDKEGYIRWGKQFRELPELFLGKDGFLFPGPMIDKMVGKANPALSASLAFLGYAKDGWQSKWMKDKKGWEKELGRAMMMASAFMPYSIPTDEDKEFRLTDLMMPSSKGFSNNKAIREFETAILAQDFDYVGAVYDACVMNKLDAEKLLRAAIARVEAQAKAEYVEGVNTLNEAWDKYQEDLNVNEKRAVRAKLNKLLQENAYKDFEKQEARDMVRSVLDGTYREEKLPDAYVANETPDDVRDAYKMDSIRLRLEKVVDAIPEDAEAYKQYYEDNKAKIDLYDETVAAKSEINLIMEDIEITPQQTELFMQEIRDIRREILELANNLTSDNE